MLERSGAVMAIGNGEVRVDGRQVCRVRDAKAGVFRSGPPGAVRDVPGPRRNGREEA
jgi:hypothetical protein